MDVKKLRKFSIASIAMASLVLCCVAFKPDNSFNPMPLDSTELQEVGRLQNGQPTLAVPKGVYQMSYPHDIQLFSGDKAIPAKNLPRQGEDFRLQTPSMESSRATMETVEPESGVNDPVHQAILSMPHSMNGENSTSSSSSLSAQTQKEKDLKAEQEKMAADLASSGLSESSLLLCTADIERKNEEYVPPKGCALISDADMTFDGAEKHLPAKALVICAPANIGTFPLDAETLESFGLIEGGKSLISTVLSGEDTSVAVYSGDSFDGHSYVVNHVEKISSSDSLLKAHFLDMRKSSPNDNVKSLIFQTTATSTPSSCKAVKKEIKFREI